MTVSRADGVVFDERGDIGIMQIRPQAGHEGRYPVREFLLDDQVPAPGQLVCAASYVNLAYESGSANAFELKRRAVLRVGRVLDVHPQGHRLCRGPCFETSMPFWSGMSGGPVFHYGTAGSMRVIGLICSDPDEDGPGKDDRSVAGRSLVALLPVVRASGATEGEQVIDLSIAATAGSGEFGVFEDFGVLSRR